MQLHEVTHDCESQAKAPVLPRQAGVGLPEPLEDVREELAIDSVSRVSDREAGLVADPAEGDLDSTAVGGELDGVPEQVGDDLGESLRVSDDDADI